MSKRLFAVDPLTGTAHYVDYDEVEDSFTIISEVDPAELIEFNKLLYNEPGPWGDGAVVARYPELVRQQLKRDGILDDPKAYARWLNDPDNRAWRIRPGRV